MSFAYTASTDVKSPARDDAFTASILSGSGPKARGSEAKRDSASVAAALSPKPLKVRPSFTAFRKQQETPEADKPEPVAPIHTRRASTEFSASLAEKELGHQKQPSVSQAGSASLPARRPSESASATPLTPEHLLSKATDAKKSKNPNYPWVKRFDPKRNKPFYANSETKKSVWEPPPNWVELDAPADDVKVQAAAEDTAEYVVALHAYVATDGKTPSRDMS
jgi:hypothetical protein